LRTEPSQPQEAPVDYVQRVNRAVDHVLTHLDAPLDLEAVARVACFSPFHFHRVFRSLMGETLHQFVKRARLERALSILSHAPDRSLTEVALECGFSSSSDFSRSFKQRYGVPPSAFDVQVFRRERRAAWQEAAPPELRHRLEGLPPGENPDGFEVELRRLPARRVAYNRVLDPYRPDVVVRAAEDLVRWADERGLGGGTWLGYMWDDPEIVAHRACRYDVGLVLPDDHPLRPADGVSEIRFPPMRVAQVEIRGPIDLEVRALDWLFRTWLPRSGYVPAGQPCFESWLGRPFQHGTEHFELLAQLPIERT